MGDSRCQRKADAPSDQLFKVTRENHDMDFNDVSHWEKLFASPELMPAPKIDLLVVDFSVTKFFHLDVWRFTDVRNGVDEADTEAKVFEFIAKNMKEGAAFYSYCCDGDARMMTQEDAKIVYTLSGMYDSFDKKMTVMPRVRTEDEVDEHILQQMNVAHFLKDMKDRITVQAKQKYNLDVDFVGWTETRYPLLNFRNAEDTQQMFETVYPLGRNPSREYAITPNSYTDASPILVATKGKRNPVTSRDSNPWIAIIIGANCDEKHIQTTLYIPPTASEAKILCIDLESHDSLHGVVDPDGGDVFPGAEEKTTETSPGEKSQDVAEATEAQRPRRSGFARRARDFLGGLLGSRRAQSK